jgi:hypothetical protein
VTAPGRVLGLGRFEDQALRDALAASMPSPLGHSLRAGFEWYACRGAFFHHDAHYGGVLFGAWCVGGPRREIVFSRSGIRVAARVGDWVAFDPFEPHAVLDTGALRYVREHYADAPVSLFVGFELDLDDSVRRAFGIGPAAHGATVLASHVAVNAESGALQ